MGCRYGGLLYQPDQNYLYILKHFNYSRIYSRDDSFSQFKGDLRFFLLLGYPLCLVDPVVGDVCTFPVQVAEEERGAVVGQGPQRRGLEGDTSFNTTTPSMC